ncbi:MAG: TIGR01212 family radical SAM protein [Fibrobacter sp.]|nr:TIGR01212 family radical SAM protein [Fibrobacter sp.]
MHYTPYRDLLLKIFPNYLKVRKLPLNGGMSCPNLDGTKSFSGCSYCNNRSFSPVFDQAKVSIQEQLDKFVPRLREKYPNAGILAYLQPYTNTHAPLEHLRGIIDPIIKHKEIAGLAIGTRPDSLEDDKVAYLAELNRKKPIIVEIGLQTANDLTLAAINRRHTLAEFEDAVKRCQAAGLTVTTHVIVGLPGETMEDFKHTAQVVRDLKLAAVKIHPLHIVAGTVMAQDYANGEIKLLNFEEYCEAVAEMIKTIGFETAIERFSGESPSDMLIAPDWCGERDKIIATVEGILSHETN